MILLAALLILFLMWGFVRIIRDPLKMIEKGDNLFNWVAPTHFRSNSGTNWSDLSTPSHKNYRITAKEESSDNG